MPHVRRMRSTKRLEKKFSANGLDNISSDPYINHSVIPARSADENAARALHLESLLDKDALVGFGHTMGYHPGGGAAGSGAGGGIFAVVKDHASVQPGGGVYGLPGDEIEKLSAGTFQVFG